MPDSVPAKPDLLNFRVLPAQAEPVLRNCRELRRWN